MSTANVESLAEVFRCFICMEKLLDARLCPHCSKLCCYPCIRRWLVDQQQQCPHCRMTLHLNDLVKCRWAEEVTNQIDTLKMTEKHEDKDQCELHKEKLTVYCSSCSKCICHQCALFNGLHINHNFQPLDDIYKINISTINDHLKQLKRQHIEYICLIQDIERNIEKVKINRDDKLREIQNSICTIQTKIDEQFQTKFDALNVQYIQYSHETQLIEHTLQNIEYQISTNSKVEIINKQNDFINTMKQIYEKSLINFIPISYNFPSEILPQYNSRTFIIKNYSQLQQNIDPIYSSSLNFDGLIWRLKVYPNGNGTVRGQYLSVFIELINGLNISSKYEYCIEMIHHASLDSTKNIIREFTSNFDIGECWGYNKFYLLENLINENFIYNNILILRFQVRSPTYKQKSRDQQWYIKQLENENQQLNNEIQNLKNKIQNHTLDISDDEYTTLTTDENDSNENTNLSSDEGLTISFNNQSGINDINSIVTDIPTEKNQSILSIITDEDFILADILERSAIDEHNQTNESTENPGELSSYQTSLNNLIFLNSQIYQSRAVKSDENQK